MIRQASSILLVVGKDKTRLAYSIPRDKEYLDVYKTAVENGEFKDEDVEKIVFFPETEYSIEEVLYHYDHEEEGFNLKSMQIDKAIDKFRKERGSLFKILDMEFMRTLEEDCEECKTHIVNIKKHMRDFPEFLKEYLNNFDSGEIKKFDFFNNVYDINILNSGNGYEETPTVTIDPPNGIFEGVQMEAEAVIEEGKLVDIKTTQVGSGYVSAPKVTISKPADGNIAIVVASRPENDIIKLV